PGRGRGGEQRAGGHGGRPLYVVVEGAEPVAISLEQAVGGLLGGGLPPEQHGRGISLGGLGGGGGEGVVFRAGDALVPPPDVERVVEPLAVVGPRVEQDRQGGAGVDAAAGGIERQLADRDAHAAGPLVAQPEDPLAVGHHDYRDLGRGGI